MADFVAVLRKTIDGLSDPTPEMREKVYEKARSTIAAKLAAINPPPPAAVADRQKLALEDAIGRVESEYAAAAPAPEPEEEDPILQLESVFASIERAKSEPQAPSPEVRVDARSDNWPRATPAAPIPPIAQKPIVPQNEPVEQEEIAPAVEPGESTSIQPAAPADDYFVEPKSPPPPPPVPAYTPAARAEPDEVRPAPETFRMPGSLPERKRSYTGLIAALVALLVLAGGGYGIWLNKDAFGDLFGSSSEVATTPEQNTPQDATPDNTAAAPPETPTPATPEAQPEPKLTQRLTEDGSETDPGPAGGEAGIGEGTSVSSATQPSTPEQPAAEQGDTPTGATAEQPAVAVGQKAIFYEERTNVAQGSAESGSVVWSTVQESPGGDLPPEPAIRAEATIPGKDLQLRLTIRRNADDTLPASHIIEVIFLTPDGFEGGGIDNILRIALKGSEQDAGSPLMGIPAKIADGFFLVALNESPAEMNNNLTLLRRQSWIDLPVVYKSGRRALFTLEKGIPGEKIFTDALNAWQAASNGQASGG